MRKILSKIAGLALGLSLATGVGVALSSHRDVAAVRAADESVTFSQQGYSNQQEITAYSGSHFSIAFAKGSNSNAPKYFTSGTAIRVYGGNTFTFSSSDTVTKIVLSYGGSDGTNAITTDVGSFSTNTWTGSSQSIKFTVGGTSGNRRLAGATVTYSSGSTLTPTETTIKIDQGSAELDLAAGTPTVQLSAEVKAGTTTVTSPAVTWSSNNTSVATVTASGLVTGKSVGTANITASYAGNTTYEGSSKIQAITVIDSNAKGGLNNPYTVAEARAAIDANTGITGVYATGIISTVESYNSTYHSLTYWISADGTTTSDQLEVYSGKNLNNTNFNGLTDISSGATVKIYGNLKKFTKSGQTIYEFDMNNYLVSYEAPTQCTLTYNVDGIKTGSVPEASASYNSGTEITIPGNTGNLTIEGYTFVGWNDGTQSYSAGDKFNITANTTLTVVFSRNSGTKGSESNPYSVAEARAAIDDGQGPKLKDACVSGLISQVDSYSSQYKSITYWISADGTTTDQVQVYSGKGLNGADFGAQTDVEVGATVVVCGLLKLHNSTYEFDKNNVQVSYTAPSTPVVNHTVTYNANGGTCDTQSETISHGGHPTFPTASLAGSVFNGWKTSGDDTLYTNENASSYSVIDDVTFVAQYTEIPSTGDYYERINSISNFEDGGKYLIVYESGNVAFNGALSTFDAVGNTVEVTSENERINASETINNAAFTISSMEGGYSFCGTSGKYFTVNSYSNNLVTSDSAVANGLDFSGNNVQITRAFEGGTMTLKYNSASNQTRFRFYKSGQQEIQLYKFVSSVVPPTPVDSTIVSGTFMYQEKQSLFVGDVVTLVVSAPEGCEVLYPSDVDNYLLCETAAYDSSTKTASFDVLVDDSVHADVELSLVWFAADGHSNYTLIEETLQIVNPEGLANARTFAGLISDECHASTKDFEALEGLFADITETEKEWLINAHYSVSGSGDNTVVTKEDDTHYEIAGAMSRYDFMVEHLGMDNFLNKSGLVQNAGRININTANSESSTIIVVIVAITSITSIGVLLVIKRRRSLVK